MHWTEASNPGGRGRERERAELCLEALWVGFRAGISLGLDCRRFRLIWVE